MQNVPIFLIVASCGTPRLVQPQGWGPKCNMWIELSISWPIAKKSLEFSTEMLWMLKLFSGINMKQRIVWFAVRLQVMGNRQER